MNDPSPQPNLSAALDYSFAFWAICVATGIGAGVGAIALMALLHVVQHLAWSYQTGAFQAAVERASFAHRIAVMTIAGIATTLGVLAIGRLVPGPSRGLTSAIWFASGRLPVVHGLLSGALSMTLVALGVSLGRENATKQYGAAVASALCDGFRPSPPQRRLLVACGAGAGMAAVYDVPLGGALFAIEVLLGSLSLPLVLPAIVTACIATAVAWPGLGNHPIYAVAAMPTTLSLTIWSILFGPLAGLAAVVFIRAVAWGRGTKPSGTAAWLLPTAVFAGVGALACAFPQVLGNGKDVAQQCFSNGAGIELLGELTAAKLLATIASLRTGAPGGLFTPAIAFGALLGGALGHIWFLFWPDGNVAAFAVVGAGAILAASTKGPISSLVLMLELTYTAEGLMVPLLLATAGATLVAGRLESRSNYSVDMPSPAILRDPTAGPLVVSTATRASVALERLVVTHAKRLLVVDEKGRSAGALSATMLDGLPRHVPLETTTASDVARPLDASSGPPDPLLDAEGRLIGIAAGNARENEGDRR